MRTALRSLGHRLTRAVELSHGPPAPALIRWSAATTQATPPVDRSHAALIARDRRQQPRPADLPDPAIAAINAKRSGVRLLEAPVRHPAAWSQCQSVVSPARSRSTGRTCALTSPRQTAYARAGALPCEQLIAARRRRYAVTSSSTGWPSPAAEQTMPASKGARTMALWRALSLWAGGLPRPSQRSYSWSSPPCTPTDSSQTANERASRPHDPNDRRDTLLEPLIAVAEEARGACPARRSRRAFGPLGGVDDRGSAVVRCCDLRGGGHRRSAVRSRQSMKQRSGRIVSGRLGAMARAE